MHELVHSWHLLSYYDHILGVSLMTHIPELEAVCQLRKSQEVTFH
jgi:hypothetical protein